MRIFLLTTNQLALITLCFIFLSIKHSHCPNVVKYFDHIWVKASLSLLMVFLYSFEEVTAQQPCQDHHREKSDHNKGHLPPPNHSDQNTTHSHTHFCQHRCNTVDQALMHFRNFNIHFWTNFCGSITIMPCYLLLHQRCKVGFSSPDHLPFTRDSPRSRHEPRVNKNNGTVYQEKFDRFKSIIDNFLGILAWGKCIDQLTKRHSIKDKWNPLSEREDGADEHEDDILSICKSEKFSHSTGLHVFLHCQVIRVPFIVLLWGSVFHVWILYL